MQLYFRHFTYLDCDVGALKNWNPNHLEIHSCDLGSLDIPVIKPVTGRKDPAMKIGSWVSKDKLFVLKWGREGEKKVKDSAEN